MGIKIQGAVTHFVAQLFIAGGAPDPMDADQVAMLAKLRTGGYVTWEGVPTYELFLEALAQDRITVECAFRPDGSEYAVLAIQSVVTVAGPVSAGAMIREIRRWATAGLSNGNLKAVWAGDREYRVVAR